jgi:cardiolipin synthase
MSNLQLTISVISLAGHVIALPWALLHKKRQPSASVAWIMAILFIPILGAVLFVIFGIDRVSRRTYVRSLLKDDIAGRQPTVPLETFLPENPNMARLAPLIQMTQRLTGLLPSTGNHLELLRDTNRTLGLIEQSIQNAQVSVHLEYYIWQPDRTGHRLRDLLIARAKDGVRIRFLYDGFGSSGLTRRFLRPMHEAGVHTATFLPGQTFRERWSLNLRNHRKIVVVDGKEAFTGGMNIGDEYIGRHSTYRFWRDAHLKISGPEVWNLQSIFAEDWLYATGEELWDELAFPKYITTGDSTAVTLSDGPDKDTDVFQAVILGALNQAVSHVCITTSYFAPPSAVVAAMENAALRGVRVRIIVAYRWTHRATLLAGRSCYDTLLRAGVEIFEYQRGMLHSKTMTVDGCLSIAGSANMDCRSLYLNFETGLLICSESIAKELEEHFEEDLRDSRQIVLSEWDQRPLYEIAGENLCRLFTPIL